MAKAVVFLSSLNLWHWEVWKSWATPPVNINNYYSLVSTQIKQKNLHMQKKKMNMGKSHIPNAF